jgi:hypothetical protein
MKPRKRMKKAAQKSELVKQVEKLFPAVPQTMPSPVAFPEHDSGYIGEQKVVQTYTTYSVFEAPIPDFGKLPR